MTNKAKDVTTLRELLFDTIGKLNDEKNPMDLERAKTIAEVAQVIINSAKVEVEHAKVTGKTTSTEFLPNDKPKDLGNNGYVHRIGDREKHHMF